MAPALRPYQTPTFRRRKLAPGGHITITGTGLRFWLDTVCRYCGSWPQRV
jgi:hypothetical protein